MTTFYDVLDKIKALLEADNDVNTVSYGRFDEIAMDKYTTYALSHFVVNDVTYQNGAALVSISLYAMDIVNQVKDSLTNEFTGDSNLHDVLNTQLAVCYRLLEQLRRGDAREEKYQLDSDATLVPFQERFEDDVAGWECTFTIVMPKLMTIC